MGVIQQQTLKGTFFLYAGVIIGFISTIAFTHTLSSSENGLISLLISYSDVFSQVASLGFSSAIGILFPYFRDKEQQHKGFFFVLSVVLLLGSAVGIVLYYALMPLIIDSSEQDMSLFVSYMFYLLPLIVFRSAFILFDRYYSVLYNTVIGIVLKEFVQRVLILGAIILHFYQLIDFDVFVLLYVVSVCLPTLFILFSLWRKNEISFKPQLAYLTHDIKHKMLSMSFYGLLISFNAIAVMRVDTIMISDMLGLSFTGIYTITFYFATLIKIPSRALSKITATVFADSWKANDLKTIEIVYYKSGLSQFIIGILLFIGIWANIENIFAILPDEYAAGRYVIFYIGITSLIEMISGGSTMMISTSKNYRILAFFMFILLALLILTNYIFIPISGITGAAIASAISTFIYFLIRYFYILKKYKMNGLGWAHLKIALIAAVAYLPSYFLPPMNHFIIDIAVRSSIISIGFSILIYFSHILPEIDAFVLKLKLFILKKIK